MKYETLYITNQFHNPDRSQSVRVHQIGASTRFVVSYKTYKAIRNKLCLAHDCKCESEFKLCNQTVIPYLEGDNFVFYI